MRYILEYNEYDQFDIDCYSIENEFIMTIMDEYPFDIKYTFNRQKYTEGALHWKERKNRITIFFDIKLEKIMDKIPVDPNAYTSDDTPEIYTQIYSSIDKINLTDKFKNAFNAFINRIKNHFRKQKDPEDEKISNLFKSISDSGGSISDDDINRFLSLKLKNPIDKMNCEYSIDVKRDNSVKFIVEFFWE